MTSDSALVITGLRQLRVRPKAVAIQGPTMPQAFWMASPPRFARG